MMHESSQHSDSSFLTLTYAPESLPAGGTLVKWHFQDFMKRLRARLSPKRVKFFHCGEYGEECSSCFLSRDLCECFQFRPTFGRPHYHAILFGFAFPDKVFYREFNKERWFKSQLLDDIWTHGMCVLGDVSFKSAGYVARYCLKKVNGENGLDHYFKLNSVTGECSPVEPEYATMSHGIGASWYEKFASDVFPSDEVISRGFSCKPPRFYDGLYAEYNPSGFERVKRDRVLAARKKAADSTPERLETREFCKERQVSSFLHRSYENHGS